MNDIGNAGLKANLDYWMALAERHRKQRDNAMLEVRKLQAILLEKTGRAYDGQDYLREIKETEASATWRNYLRNFTEALRELR
jgi:phage-related protein